MQRSIFLVCSLLLLTTGCNQTNSLTSPQPSQTTADLPSLEQLRDDDLSLKPRVVILTDFGEDPDDEQSMVRFLLYANEFDIEGLLVTADGSDDNLKIQDDLLIEYLDRYDAIQANLSNHAEGYPSAATLKKLVKPDKWVLKKEAQVGAEHQTLASEHIISVVDREDPRPIWFLIWGGPRPLSQALWQVKQERSPAAYQEFLSKIRLYSIDKQDQTFAWLEQNATEALTILSASGGRPQQTFRGMYLTGDTTTVKKKWLQKNIIDARSPLGQIYPAEGAGVPGIKEGDTPSFLYLLSQRVGLSNIAFPSQGGWGGRFLKAQGSWYSDRDALDNLDGNWDRRHSVSRWRNDFNRDFAARMDWSTTSELDRVNHPPQVRVKIGDRAQTAAKEDLWQQIAIAAQANETIYLNATDSNDPDGDNLQYDWFYYPEAGNYDDEIELENTTQANASLTLPADWQQGHQISIILRVTDSGSPPLTRYRRVIIGASEPLATQNFDSSTTEKLSILPLGDSITQAAKDRNSYRRSLYQKLVAAGHNVDFVGSMTQTKDCTDYPARDFDFDHEGHWDWRIDEIIEGRNARCYGKGKLADWLNNYAPDSALIHLGSNDVFRGNSVASSSAELKQVVQILRKKNPDIVIFLAQLIGAKDKQRNQTIIKLNEQIPTLAAELERANSPVIVVDQYTDFNPRQDTYDGVHPNQRGEAKMAQKWFEAINAYLKSAR